MSDGTTTKRVVYELDVKSGPRMAQPFNDMEKSAHQARQAADKVKESMNGEQLAHRLRTADRGVRSLSRGFMEMAVVAGGASEKGRKAVEAVVGFHAGVEIIRGLIESMTSLTTITGNYAKSIWGAVTANKALASSRREVAAIGMGREAAGAVGGAGGAAMGGTLKGKGFAESAALIAVGSVLTTKSEDVEEHLGFNPANWFASFRGKEGSGEKAVEQMELMRSRRLALEANIREQYATKKPFEDAETAYRERIAAMASARAGIGFGEASRAGAKSQLLNQGTGLLGAAPGTPGLLRNNLGEQSYVQDQQQKLVDLAGDIAERHGQAAQNVFTSQEAMKRAEQETAKREQKLAEWANKKNHLEEEGLALRDRFLEAANKEFEAADKYNDALREQNKIRAEGQKQFGEFAKQQAEHYRQIKLQIDQATKSMTESIGAMSPAERAASVNILQKLQRGPGAGRAPGMRFDARTGKMVFDPGSPGGLTPQEISFAQSHSDLFGEQLAQFRRQQADRDPLTKRILEMTGQTAKAKEAEAAEKYYRDIKVEIQNKIDAEIKLNEESLAAHLEKSLVPKILKAVESVRIAADKAVERKEQERMQQAKTGK